MAYACTSGSFFKGEAWDAAVIETISAITAKPTTAASPSVVAALRHLGAHRLSVATPYPEWTNQRLKAYLEANGFEVLNIASDERAAARGHRGVNDQPPAEIAAFVSRISHDDADAVFCSCTAWRAVEAADEIERECGKPVVTSNQALFWATLRAVGAARPLQRGGMLLREMNDANQRAPQ
jgi:maleate cis-trans isomerase